MLKKNWLQYLILFLLCFNFFFFLQTNSTLYDPDAFYHLKMAELIKDQGIILDFPWQQFTVLKDYFTDQHLLYHLLIIPFITVFDSFVGVKIAQSFFSSALIVTIFFLLKQFKIKYSWLPIIILLSTSSFILRLSLIKASPLALLLLFLGIYFIYRQKYFWLYLISFLYVWSHGGFIILLILSILYGFILIIKEKKYSLALKSILTVSSGFISGLIINPYFPQNLKFYWQQLVQIGLINYKDKIIVGAEWYPPHLFEIIPPNGPIFILLILGLICFILLRHKQTTLNYFFLSCSLLFLVATFKSRRYIEYFIPLTFFFSLTTLNTYWQSSAWQKKIITLKQQLLAQKSYLFLIAYLIIALIMLFVSNSQIIIKNFNNPDYNYYFSSSAAEYLKVNTSPGQTIFHTRWDYWPQYFYHNNHNNFLVGLDPTFMYNYDPETYKVWADLKKGQYKNNSAQIILKQFNAEYALIQKDPHDYLLLAYLKRDPQVKTVYQDDQFYIFKINHLDE